MIVEIIYNLIQKRMELLDIDSVGVKEQKDLETTLVLLFNTLNNLIETPASVDEGCSTDFLEESSEQIDTIPAGFVLVELGESYKDFLFRAGFHSSDKLH